MLKTLAVGLLLAAIVTILGIASHASPVAIVATAVLIALASILGDAWRRSRRRRIEAGVNLR